MIDTLMQYKFLQNAVISAILASIACGIIGPVIIEKRLVMMSGGIAHTAFGGIGLGFLLGIEPIIGAILVTLGAAMGVVAIKRKTSVNTDIPIGIFWAAGMSLGILFIALSPGYPRYTPTYLGYPMVSRDTLYHSGIDLLIVFTVSPVSPNKGLFDEELSTVIG